MSGDDMLPLYLYNMPNLTKMHYALATVKIASEMPHVYGLKDSSGDMEYVKQVLAAVRDKKDFAVLVGPEHLLLEGLRAGIHGGVCGGGNLMPRLFADLFAAFERKDLANAQQLQDRIIQIGEPLYRIGEPESSYIRGLKAALSITGICSGELAWPYLSAQPEQMAIIRKHLSSVPELQVSIH
jgi:4-hydroxy-tetrahydrodipicolinate synthase